MVSELLHIDVSVLGCFDISRLPDVRHRQQFTCVDNDMIVNGNGPQASSHNVCSFIRCLGKHTCAFAALQASGVPSRWILQQR